MHLSPTSSYFNKTSRNRVLSSFSDPNTPDCIRQVSLSSFGKSPKLPKLQNTLYTLKMCELCLDTNLLSRYDNGRMKEKRLQWFSLRMNSSLSKRWVCVVENLSRVFLFEWPLLQMWVMRVYIVWVKPWRVRKSYLKILQAESLAGISREGLTCEILAKLTAWHDSSASNHVLLRCPFRGKPSHELLAS